MPLRKSYTAAFKLEAVAYAKKNGNRATGRHFSINENEKVVYLGFFSHWLKVLCLKKQLNMNTSQRHTLQGYKILMQ
jgi:hypothetical protein